VNSSLHSLQHFRGGVAKLEIEQLESAKLRTSGLRPLPPHPCDLPFLLHGLQKVLQTRIENWAGGGPALDGRDFHQTTRYLLFTKSVGSLLVQAQHWLGPVTPKASRLPSIPISASQ